MTRAWTLTPSGRDGLVHDDGRQRTLQIWANLTRGIVHQPVPDHDVVGPLPQADRNGDVHDGAAVASEANAWMTASTAR